MVSGVTMHLLRQHSSQRAEFLFKTCNTTFVRDHSLTLVRGAWCKKGGLLKFLTLVRESLEKKYHKFSSENWVYMFFHMGLTHNFHGKKGWPEIFWGLKGGGPFFFFFFALFSLASGPPYKCLWTVPKAQFEQVDLNFIYFENGCDIIVRLYFRTSVRPGFLYSPTYSFKSICFQKFFFIRIVYLKHF